MNAIRALLADAVNPVINYYYLAGDEVKSDINRTKQCAAREKELCDDLRRHFNFASLKFPKLFKARQLTNNSVPVSLYFFEGDKPTGWITPKNLFEKDFSRTTTPVNFEKATSYKPTASNNDDIETIRQFQNDVMELRKSYGAKGVYLWKSEYERLDYAWESVMWAHKFGLPRDDSGTVLRRPTIIPINDDYIIRFPAKLSETNNSQHILPSSLQGKLTPISNREFKAVTDEKSRLPAQVRLNRIKREASGLTNMDKVLLKYIV